MTANEPLAATTAIHGLNIAIITLAGHGIAVYDAPYGRYDLSRPIDREQWNLSVFDVIRLSKTLALRTARATLLERRIYTYDNRQFPGLYDLVHPGLPRRDGLAPEEIIRYAEGLK